MQSFLRVPPQPLASPASQGLKTNYRDTPPSYWLKHRPKNMVLCNLLYIGYGSIYYLLYHLVQDLSHVFWTHRRVWRLVWHCQVRFLGWYFYKQKNIQNHMYNHPSPSTWKKKLIRSYKLQLKLDSRIFFQQQRLRVNTWHDIHTQNLWTFEIFVCSSRIQFYVPSGRASLKTPTVAVDRFLIHQLKVSHTLTFQRVPNGS